MDFSYRSRTILVMSSIAMLVGIAMGIGIVLLINPPTFSDVDRVHATPAVSPVQVAAGNSDLQASDAATPVPTASPTATLAVVSTTSQTATATTVPTENPTAVPTTAPTENPTAVPTTAPTENPTAVPTSAPTATPLPTPTTEPTTVQRSATALLNQVAEAEETLRTGQFEAAIDYGNGNRSSARMRFDFGDAQQSPRVHITTTYESAEGTQTVERITVGATTWERQPDGSWTTVSAQAVVWDQVQMFLPHAAAASDAEIVRGANTVELHWDDAGRDAEVTLLVDPDTGTPQEMRRLSRATGLALTVTYSGWNTPVEIRPPDGT